MQTEYIHLNNSPYQFIRIDTIGGETLITVTNVSIKDVGLLVEKLEGLQADREVDAFIPNPICPPKPGSLKLAQAVKPAPVANAEPEEHPVMTAVLGPKPDPTAWYKNALVKEAAKPIEANPQFMPPKISNEPDPIMPAPQWGKGIIHVVGVKQKDYTHFGKTHEGEVNQDMNADIMKGQWIRIYGISNGLVKYDKETKASTHYKVAYDKTFKIGDTAEYDSYNTSFTGKIVAIGEKTVTISKGHGERSNAQLDLYTFIRRNWDYDAERIAEERANYYD